MPLSLIELAREAACHAILLKAGVIDTNAVIEWADSAIVRYPRPSQDLVQLSITGCNDIGEILTLITRVQAEGAISDWDGLKQAIPQICDYIKDSTDRGESIASYLYNMTWSLPGCEPPKEFHFLYSADDDYYLARDMQIGSTEIVHQQFIDALTAAAVA